jgi:hypothetical protein
MDIGFHNCVGRALQVHVSAEENIRRSLQVRLFDSDCVCVARRASQLDNAHVSFCFLDKRRRHEQVLEQPGL